MIEEAARDAYERAERVEKDFRARIQREVTALQTATEDYTRAMRHHLDMKARILKLRLHVRDNILHYMQAIWMHEHKDQRTFRLHKVPVPKLSGTVTLTEVSPDPNALPMPPNWTPAAEFDVSLSLDAFDEIDLAEAADLDTVLGFKGNYMIFPLLRSNALTDFLMAPYLDPFRGVRDPDELGNWTLDDFSRYVCCLREKLASGELSGAELDVMLPGLRQLHQALLTDPRRPIDEITVPSGSLHIEALPGTKPLLEDFKLMHRAVDVKKVQAETRRAELENLRMATRLLKGELGDPDVDKQINITGAPGIVMDVGNL